MYLKQNYKMGPFYQQHWVKWEFPYLSNLIIINTKLQGNLKRRITYYRRHVGELFNQYYI